MPNNGNFVIGYDAGGSNVRAAVFDPQGEMIAEDRRSLIGVFGGDYPAAVGDCIEEAIKKAVDGGVPRKAIAAIGGSQAGLIDAGKGTIIFSPNIKQMEGSDQGVENLPIGPYLQNRFGRLPVWIDNDGNMAAFGVYSLDPNAKGLTDIAYFIMGSGIGGGAIIDGKTFPRPFEVGHTKVADAERICGCKAPGCWEGVSSGTGIERMANREDYIVRGINSILRKSGYVKASDVFEAARKGSIPAANLLREGYEATARGIANIITLLMPQAVFIGESVAVNNPEVLAHIKGMVPPLLLPGFPVPQFYVTKVLDPGLRGAGLYASHRLSIQK